MEYTIRNIALQYGIPISETIYAHASDSFLDFKLISGDFYKWENGRLRFKNCVTIRDFTQNAKLLPPFDNISYKSREMLPYCTGELSLLSEAWRNGRKIAVEGGPCLFSQHEVIVRRRYLADEKTIRADKSNSLSHHELFHGAKSELY